MEVGAEMKNLNYTTMGMYVAGMHAHDHNDLLLPPRIDALRFGVRPKTMGSVLYSNVTQR